MPRAAIIANPVKIADHLRSDLTAAFAARGWDEPLWLETTEDDPGHAMAREALDAGVDRVVAAGGDGTVRVVAGVLAETGTPLALIPSGTGNLLARNLNIPLRHEDAVELAVSDAHRSIDLIRIVVDDGEPTWSAVMAGCGFDAMVMEHVDEDLKAKIGPGAYFVAAAQQVGRLPVQLKIWVDDERAFHRYAVVCLIANVGQLTGGLDLIPDADPADGRLNLYVASPRRVTDILRLIVRVLFRHRRPDKALDQIACRRVSIRAHGGDDLELDGDAAGRMDKLDAEIVPGALEIVAPPV